MRDITSPALADLHCVDFALNTPATRITTSEILTRLRPDLANAALQYGPSLSHHSSLLPLTLTQADAAALRRIYKTMSGFDHASALRAAILSNPGNPDDLCAYCGIGEATEIDHFLPKKLFAEFSTLVTNLVPACAKCNKNKGIASVALDGSRYLHAYVDRIGATPVLSASLGRHGETIFANFSIDWDSLPAPLAKGLRRAQKKLNLLERFDNAGNKFIASRKPSIVHYLDVGPRNCAHDLFDQETREHVLRFGVNHWRSALLASITALRSE